MNTCEYAGTPFTELRSHPWIDTVDNPECRYYDLTLSPELIRTSLEDFLPWSNYKAIENFYKILEDLNQSIIHKHHQAPFLPAIKVLVISIAPLAVKE